MVDDNLEQSTSQILQKLSSQVGGSYDGGEVKISTKGRDYFFFIYLPVRSGVPPFVVGLSAFFELKTQIPYEHPEFLINKTELTNLIAEHIVGSRNFQTGDPTYDSKIRIKLHNGDWGARFFSDENTKQSILDLLYHGFDLIRSEDGYLKIIKFLLLGCSYPTAELIINAIEKIDSIISTIPAGYNKNDALEIQFTKIEETNKIRSGCLFILVLSIAIPVVFWILTRSLGLYIARLWQ